MISVCVLVCFRVNFEEIDKRIGMNETLFGRIRDE
jgi:hypothetical protein